MKPTVVCQLSKVFLVLRHAWLRLSGWQPAKLLRFFNSCNWNRPFFEFYVLTSFSLWRRSFFLLYLLPQFAFSSLNPGVGRFPFRIWCWRSLAGPSIKWLRLTCTGILEGIFQIRPSVQVTVCVSKRFVQFQFPSVEKAGFSERFWWFSSFSIPSKTFCPTDWMPIWFSLVVL